VDASNADGGASRQRDRWRSIGIAVVAVLGLAYFGWLVNTRYPIGQWFAWPLLLMIGYTLVFQGACLSIGARLLDRILGDRRLPLLEAWIAAMGLGLIVFVFAMYIAGMVGLFITPVAIALPIAAFAFGGRRLAALVRRTVAEWPPTTGTAASRLWVTIASGAGVVGVLVIYGIGFSPDAISFDAQWYHLPIAQDYARTGRIIAFPSDYNRSFPHLSSIAYTWGYLMPGLSMPLQWMMALHLEFAMVVWKLVGIAALAQWMLGDRPHRALWLGLFLFPAIFAFGNTVGGGAEHFLAFWAAPMLTSTARMLEQDFEPRQAVLLGAFAGGATLTKYQAIYMVLACGSWIALRWLIAVVRHAKARRSGATPPSVSPRNLWLAPMLVIVVTIGVAAPHFIKNLVLYSNPLYPFAQDALGGNPTHDQAAELWRTMLGEERNHPKAKGIGRLWWTFQIFGSFSFYPHYTVGYVKTWPLFGSLYTLLLPLLLFLKDSRRIWIGAWCGFVVLAIWGNTYLTDRYLNAAVPVFAAVTVALIVRAWSAGWIARVALAPLVAFQLIWSSDVAMYSGEKLLASTMKIWASGWDLKATEENRFGGYFPSFRAVTAATPPDARILLRGSRPSLGLDRETWLDLQWGQAALFYQPLSNGHDLWTLYRDRGITHLVWRRAVHYSGTLQSTVLFALLIDGCDKPRKQFGGYDMVELCSEPIAPAQPVRVLVRKQKTYVDGIYNVEDLRVFGRHSVTEREHIEPREKVDFRKAPPVTTALDGVDVALFGRPLKLPAEADKVLRRDFEKFEALETVEVWLRKNPRH